MTTRMIEYSTVYGRFYRNGAPVDGTAIFVPRRYIEYVDGNLYTLERLEFPVIGGTLMSNGTEGAALPATFSGITWSVTVLPVNYVNVVESFPGDIFSLGD